MTEPTLTETALALHIQEGHAIDPAIASVLVKQYAPGVKRFTLSLLNGQADAPETAQTITRRTFATRLNDPDSFAGKENIRAWLYAQALRQARALPKPQQAHPHPSHAGEIVPGLDTLPPQEALPLLLRYGHRLPLDEIAHLLRTSENKIHKYLASARQKLIQQFPPHTDTSFIPTSTPQQTNQATHPHTIHSHFPRETQLLLDHLLAPDAEATLRDHLDICLDCRTHLKNYAELEFHLNTRLYHDPQLPEDQIEEILTAVAHPETLPQPQTWQPPSILKRLPLREMAWVLVAASIFFVLARWLNPFFSTLPPSATPTPAKTPTLPPAQALSTVFREANPITTNPFPGQHIAWSLTRTQSGNHIPTTPLVFSWGGDHAAFGMENMVILWESLDNEFQREFVGHQTIITALEFSPDGVRLATGDESGNVLIWDTQLGEVRFRLEDHPGPIRNLAYSADGRYLAVGLNTGIWIWEVQTQSIIRFQAIQWEWIRGLTFSPDGKWLAAADRNDTVAVWKMPEAQLLLRYETIPTPEDRRLDIITRLAFSPDGKKLASGSFNGMVEIVSLSPMADGKVQGTRLFVLPHPSWISEVRWSPDGTTLITVSDSGLSNDADQASRAVYLWDVEEGILLHAPLSAQIARGLSRAVLDATGQVLTASNFDGSLFQWSLEDVSHLVAAVPDTRFFTRSDSNVVDSPPVEVRPTIEFTDTIRALMVGFPTLALSPNSPQYTFLHGNYSARSGVVDLFYQTGSGKTVRITQQQAPAGDLDAFASTVGASAVIQPVQINGTMGEYVVGSWTQTYPDNFENPAEANLYRWQPAGEARLRWIQGSLLIEVQTPLFQFNENNLSLNDLVRLAENLASQTDRPLLLNYTIQDGDTCVGLAQRFGTTVDQIIQANQLDNCDLIVTGLTLSVPLTTARETIAEVDLDCNGSLERIRAIPDPNLADLSANFGVVLETIPEGGEQFWPRWQWTIADLPAAFFSEPVIYTIADNECSLFLGVSLFGGAPEDAGLNLYRWDGMGMELVLDANGYPLQTILPDEGFVDASRITTIDLARDVVGGDCVRTTTTYVWNGTAFVQTDEVREEGLDCLDG